MMYTIRACEDISRIGEVDILEWSQCKRTATLGYVQEYIRPYEDGKVIFTLDLELGTCYVESVYTENGIECSDVMALDLIFVHRMA